MSQQINQPGVHRHVVARSEMLKALEEVKRANSERNGLTHGLSTSTYKLAKLLDEVAEKQYCEHGAGVSFRTWVEQLKDEEGKPRTYGWAKGLRRQLRKINHHPDLVAILERQNPEWDQFVSFNSAFHTARLAEEDNWTQKVAHAMRADGVSREDWETEKHNRLQTQYFNWGVKSVREILDRIAELRQDQEDDATPKAWPHHGGRVDPNVKMRYDEALERLAKLTDAGDPGEMTYTREVECFGEGVNDLLDALDAAATGDTTPLRSWLEQLAGE